MMNLINRITLDLKKSNLTQYWPDFKIVAFALYDSSNVYLFNHPNHRDLPNTYQTIEWNEQFVGCTLILFEEYPTAIVNLEMFNDYESLYSIIVHELFHGYQYLKDEKRFPDEILGITYPLTNENIGLRNQERFHLYHALLEKDIQKKKFHVCAFMTLRDHRAVKIGEYHSYERMIETVEGPAWYVEFMAYEEKSQLEYISVLQKYGEYLIDPYESASNIRRSCYSSGLAMCFLLDELSPGWKVDYLDREETLYDFFKGKVSYVPIDHIELASDTEGVIQYAIGNREKEFRWFEELEGELLIIEGEMRTTSFDPMNIILLDNRLLHKNFLKVNLGSDEFLIQQPVLASFIDRIQIMNKMQLKLKKEPIVNNDSITVESIGVIKGRYHKQGTNHHLYLHAQRSEISK
ncbi:hypothetical protein EJA10_02515 [Mesobacillus subterraneus]|uniref:Peptide ABC transporter permease n=2 Tax=Mesobacillus subterraneus TaxID=285983 RepID=A0A3R9ED38_9BACI|nr:hypothetical protein EJA10_02515 [Mesobacillus subterraneus]